MSTILSKTTYEYDDAHNRVQKVKDGVTADYSYNELNQLTGFTEGTRQVAFAYDDNGNRVSRTEGGTTDSYSYDYENRLVSLQKGGVSYAYTYDYRTRRVERVEGSTTTKIVFSGGTSVQEYEGTNKTVEYVRGSDFGGGIGGILYTLRSGQPSYTHYNNRGDVVAKTDGNKALTYQATYEAFGKRTQEVGQTQDRQKANTKDEDPTGLLNEGFRYRDLETGSFITRDPLGHKEGPNLYTYVHQNPWSKFDPEGLHEVEIPGTSRKPVHEVTSIRAWAEAKGFSSNKAFQQALKTGDKAALNSFMDGARRPDIGNWSTWAGIAGGSQPGSTLTGTLGYLSELARAHLGSEQREHCMSSGEETAGAAATNMRKSLSEKFASALREMDKNPTGAWGKFGEISHTLTDAYAPAHVSRDEKTLEIQGFYTSPGSDMKAHGSTETINAKLNSSSSDVSKINIDDFDVIASERPMVSAARNAVKGAVNALTHRDQKAFEGVLDDVFRVQKGAFVNREYVSPPPEKPKDKNK